MELKLRLSALIITLSLLSGCSSTENSGSEYAYTQSMNYSEMVELHYRQAKTKKGFQYEAYQLIPEHNKFWSPIAKKCRPLTQEEGVSSFEFVFVVDRSGMVIDAKSKLDTAGVNCFLSGVRQIKYPVPPYENWYEVVNVR